jgi:hypothetical protein
MVAMQRRKDSRVPERFLAERLPGWRRKSVSLDELAGLIAPVPAPPRYTDPPKSMEECANYLKNSGYVKNITL